MANGAKSMTQATVQANLSFLSSTRPADGDIRMDEAAQNEMRMVTAAQAGDSTAFVTLCNLHSDKILRRLYRITKNWEDAEDALQDSFLKAYLNLTKFEGRSNFSSWLTRIAINSALMLLRKKRSRNEIPFEITTGDEHTPQQRDVIDPAENPELRYSRCESSERLGAAIPKLRPCFRSVVELHHLHEYSTAEIADTLRISVPAVKSRLLRAKGALRRSLVRADQTRPVSVKQSQGMSTRINRDLPAMPLHAAQLAGGMSHAQASQSPN